MMAVDRGLAVLCVAVFLGLTALAGRFRFPRVSMVATSAIVVGLVTARIGYVATHWARSEEHTSELQSLMRISYAVSCLKKKKQKQSLKTNYDRSSKKSYDTQLQESSVV